MNVSDGVVEIDEVVGRCQLLLENAKELIVH
jgi:hypothetical protein